MNLLTIASKSIRQRALASSLTALSVALGITLMVTVLVIYGVVDQMFNQSAVGYDFVVGPKGSRLQLVLNAIYRVSQPIENLPYRFYREMKEDSRVEEAVPLALGDTTDLGGFPILGTIPRYFLVEYAPGKKFRANGELMAKSRDSMIGATVARKNGWQVGTRFRIRHGGMEGDEHIHDDEFTVVSVLEPTGTPNDKTVFVHLDGFYALTGHDKPLEEALRREADFFGESAHEDAHKHDAQHEPDPDQAAVGHPEKTGAEASHAHDDHDDAHDAEAHDHDHEELLEAQKEVTAILVRLKSPIMAPAYRAEMNEGLKAQAVSPMAEIKWLMDNVVGNVRTLIVVLTALIVVVSGVGIFVSIYNSMADRRKEIAIMRALGARRQTVFSIILAESVLLCVAGGVLGIVLGHGLVFLASPIVEARSGLLLNPFAFEPLELVLFPVLIVLASLIGFVPAMTAYRTDVAQTLSD